MQLTPLILAHLFLIALPFLLVLSASPSPSPDPYPAVVSLPSRQSPVQQAVTQAPPRVDHDLLPFVLISTIDGALHAVDRDEGKVRWTLKDGVDPLVGGGMKGKGTEEEYIVEPLSGGLYVFDEEGGPAKVRKLPLSVEQLIELSPFTFPHSPSRIFTGSKQTSLITIDLRTGQQLDCFSSLSANLSSAGDNCMCESDQLLDDMDARARRDSDILMVGRTDYRLTIHSPGSGSYSPSSTLPTSDRPAGVQEIIYSTYTPNSFDRPLADFWSKAGASHRFVEEDGQEVKIRRVELAHNGVAVGVEQGGGVKWTQDLGNIGIAVYDILLPLSPAAAKPILVPQPPPDLPSLFPPPARPHPSHMDIHTKPPSTYIGSVPLTLTLPPADNTSTTNTLHPDKPLLYALSSTAYPLINFAPPPRPGSLLNGSFPLSEELPERDQLLPYLLDPPAEEMSVQQANGLEMSEAEGIVEKPKHSRAWLLWFLGVVSALALCAGVAFGYGKTAAKVKQSASPPSEKTPLLPADEKPKVVTFEPGPDTTALQTESSVAGNGDRPSLAPPINGDDATPKKKSTRRRVRGKKKPRDASTPGGKEGDEEDEDDRDSSSPKSGEKPLPELPREMSSVALADDMHEKERLVISESVIGYGSHGTVVLKGTWGGRPVAVKRLLSDFTRLASQEVKLLQASDDHPNVIRYYCQERRDNFLYIALDLCQASLADLIEAPDKHAELVSSLDRKKALVQVTAGLKHLHGMKIIHRDIKPQNVLVSRIADGQLRVMVSDFGLARRLEQDQSSFAPTANNLAGSLGWRAPECIRGQVRLNEDFDRVASFSSSSSSGSLLDLESSSDEREKGRGQARLTKAVDLFALGCLYFWVLMSGEHPFGATYDRESNIVKGEVVNMGMLDILGEEGVEAQDMIARLLSLDQFTRPDTSDCLTHPFFWTPAKRLAFLCDASDRFEIMELEPPEAALVMLESDAIDVVGRDWCSKLDKTFTSSLGKYRKYKGGSVRDLLRAMRNKKHHYQDLEPAAKRHLGALPAGFLHYFTSRYPRLFLHVYAVVKGSRLRHESMFEGYFAEG